MIAKPNQLNTPQQSISFDASFSDCSNHKAVFLTVILKRGVKFSVLLIWSKICCNMRYESI